MMNKFFKVMLVIITLLLTLNLLQGHLRLFLERKAIAAYGETFCPVKHIVCSSCGKYIYMVSGTKLIRSQDFGYSWIELIPPMVIPKKY